MGLVVFGHPLRRCALRRFRGANGRCWLKPLVWRALFSLDSRVRGNDGGVLYHWQ